MRCGLVRHKCLLGRDGARTLEAKQASVNRLARLVLLPQPRSYLSVGYPRTPLFQLLLDASPRSAKSKTQVGEPGPVAHAA